MEMASPRRQQHTLEEVSGKAHEQTQPQSCSASTQRTARSTTAEVTRAAQQCSAQRTCSWTAGTASQEQGTGARDLRDGAMEKVHRGPPATVCSTNSALGATGIGKQRIPLGIIVMAARHTRVHIEHRGKHKKDDSSGRHGIAPEGGIKRMTPERRIKEVDSRGRHENTHDSRGEA